MNLEIINAEFNLLVKLEGLLIHTSTKNIIPT